MNGALAHRHRRYDEVRKDRLKIGHLVRGDHLDHAYVKPAAQLLGNELGGANALVADDDGAEPALRVLVALKRGADMQGDVDRLDLGNTPFAVGLQDKEVIFDGVEDRRLVGDNLSQRGVYGEAGGRCREHRLQVVREILEQSIVPVQIDPELLGDVSHKPACDRLYLHVLNREDRVAAVASGLEHEGEVDGLPLPHLHVEILREEPQGILGILVLVGGAVDEAHLFLPGIEDAHAGSAAAERNAQVAVYGAECAVVHTGLVTLVLLVQDFSDRDGIVSHRLVLGRGHPLLGKRRPLEHERKKEAATLNLVAMGNEPAIGTALDREPGDLDDIFDVVQVVQDGGPAHRESVGNVRQSHIAGCLRERDRREHLSLLGRHLVGIEALKGQRGEDP